MLASITCRDQLYTCCNEIGDISSIEALLLIFTLAADDHNQWLFATLGLTIQLHQLQAFKKGRSTWNKKRTGHGINFLPLELLNMEISFRIYLCSSQMHQRL